MVVVNFVIPICVLPFRWGRKPLPVAIVSVGVLVGMWLERFLIIVPSLQLPRLAYTLGSYTPSWVELSILVGSAGLFAFLYFSFTMTMPIISVWEVREGWQNDAAHGEGSSTARDTGPLDSASEPAGGGS